MWAKGFNETLKYSYVCKIIATLFCLIFYTITGVLLSENGAEPLVVGAIVSLTMIIFQMLFKKKIKKILNPLMSIGLAIYGICVLFYAGQIT
jgi:membrane protease YdiL (CAAX protease family)